MEVHFTPDAELHLHHIAISQGKEMTQVVEETFTRAWELLQEQDAWLAAHREAMDEKIRDGIAQLERGEGIPEDELDAYLTRLKALPE